MITVKELQRWLKTLPPDSSVGIDDGGLMLQLEDDPETYMEVGGLPDEDEDEEEEPENIPCKTCGRTDLPLHINRNCAQCGPN